MKRIYKYFAVALAVTTLASCDDFIEDNRYPLDEQTNSPMYWNNAANVTNQCNTFYNNYYGYGRGDSGGLFYYKTLSDDQAGRSFTNWTYVNALASMSDWSSPFVEIRRANYIINNVRTSSLSDVEKRNYEGIARLNRAWQYFDLVRKFGDVQWIGVVVDPADSEVVYAARDDRDVVMDSVLADLNYACANIKAQSGKTAWSKDMANAMKADITLWEGTFCKYRTQADNGKAADAARAEKFLKECVTACEKVMASGYEIGDDYQATYNSTSLSGSNNIIFFKEYQNNLMYHSLIAYTCSSTQINGMTKDAFDAYLFKDGKPLALTTENKSDVGEVDADGNYSIAKLLEVRDGRLAKTIDPIVYYQGMSWARSGAMEMTSSTGYGVSKYDNVDLPLDNRTQTVKNYTCAPIYWLEVVYCNYAEAKAELGTITDADLDKTINKLYARAGLPALKANVGFSDPANNWGVSDIIWEVRRCRRCELMFDNWFRYWDLVRWHKLDKLDSQKNPNILLGANMTAAPVDILNVGGYVDGSHGGVRVYNSKYYLYPIPTDQITLNDKLTQNPGW
jgi:hypothetical protein